LKLLCFFSCHNNNLAFITTYITKHSKMFSDEILIVEFMWPSFIHHISCHQPNACWGTSSQLIIMEVKLCYINLFDTLFFFNALQCLFHINIKTANSQKQFSETGSQFCNSYYVDVKRNQMDCNPAPSIEIWTADSLCTHSPMKIEQTECYETLAIKLHMPENNPKENVQHDSLQLYNV
jgi:hypothetical protein